MFQNFVQDCASMSCYYVKISCFELIEILFFDNELFFISIYKACEYIRNYNL